MTTNLDRPGGLANSNLMPGSADGGGGDGGGGDGGLSQRDVDARIRSRVDSAALAGNTAVWPDVKLPATLTRDSELAVSIADFLKDRGIWTASSEYLQHDLVRHSDAAYIALQRAAPGTDAATEPGAGTNWESYWYRVGFEDGPPNAFVGALISGQTLTLQRESGTSPLELALPTTSAGGIYADSPYAYFVQEKFSPNEVSTRTNISRTGAGFISVLIAEKEVPGGLLPDRDFITEYEGAIKATFDTSTGLIVRAKFTHIIPARASFPEREFSSVRERVYLGIPGDQEQWISLNDFNSRTRIPTGTFSVAGTQYTVEQADLDAPSRIKFEVELITTANKDATTRNGEVMTHFIVDRGGVTYYQLAAFAVPEFAPQLLTDRAYVWGGGTGTAIPILAGVSGTDSLMAPEGGFVLVAAHGFGAYEGNVTWRSTSDLRAATAADPLHLASTGGVTFAPMDIYVDGSNQIFVHPRTAGTPGNNDRIAIWHVPESQATGRVAPGQAPTITRFDVQGDNSPAAGSIAGDTFAFDAAIGQTARVSAARIVGFAGTAAAPDSVSVLHTLTDYHGETGRIAIPAGVSLTVGGSYTLRLEVYETGQTTAEQPRAYHDYRITAHAAAAAVHFGRVLSTEAAADIAFADDDISTAGTVARTWVAHIPDDSNSYRLYWAVPAAETQPADWSTGGISINAAIAAAVDRTIGGVAYKIYLFTVVSAIDHLYDGTPIVVTA